MAIFSTLKVVRVTLVDKASLMASDVVSIVVSVGAIFLVIFGREN